MEYGGPVCFLFTDIAGSTPMWQEHPVAMREAIALHNRILSDSISAGHGRVFKTVGDAYCSCFPDVSLALRTAQSILAQLESAPWPQETPIHIRTAIHWGVPLVDGQDYQGHEVNLVSRILGQAHPGQILVSEVAARAQVGFDLVSLGHVSLKGISENVLIYQLGGSREDFPPLTGLGESPTNIRRPLTDLVGRGTELDNLQDTFTKSRCVTLLGPGGIGKTHLATEFALAQRPKYPDGVWFVDLADLPSGSEVEPAVMSVIAPRASQPFAHLHNKRMLVVLDNCEHVLPSTRSLVRELLQQTDVVVLSTTRELLGVPGERSIALQPLGTSGDASAAEELFLARCDEVCPGIPREQSREVAGKLVEAFAGFPLAIVLAASLAASYPLAVLYDMVMSGKELQAAPGAAPERHRSVETTISWSYQLLSSADQAVLQRMTVFAGSVEYRAVLCVAAFGEIDEALATSALSRLTRASLVQLDPVAGRYSMYQPIKEFAHARLREDAEGFKGALHRHLTWVFDLSEEARPQLDQKDADKWMKRLETEHGNVRQAFANASGAELLARIVVNLHYFWITGAHVQEGLSWTRSVIPGLQTSDHALLSAALSAQGVLEWCAGDLDAAATTLTSALENVDSAQNRAKITTNLALVHYNLKDYPTALQLLREAEAIYGELGAKFLQNIVRMNICTLLHETEQLSEAIQLLGEVIERARELERPVNEVHARRVLCECLIRSGVDTESAKIEARAATQGAFDLGDKFGAAAGIGLILLLSAPACDPTHVGYWAAARADVETSNPWLCAQIDHLGLEFEALVDNPHYIAGKSAWLGGDVREIVATLLP